MWKYFFIFFLGRTVTRPWCCTWSCRISGRSFFTISPGSGEFLKLKDDSATVEELHKAISPPAINHACLSLFLQKSKCDSFWYVLWPVAVKKVFPLQFCETSKWPKWLASLKLWSSTSSPGRGSTIPAEAFSQSQTTSESDGHGCFDDIVRCLPPVSQVRTEVGV